MKRTVGVVAGLALIGVLATGCVPPRPAPRAYELKVSRVHVDLSSGFTEVDGTVRYLLGGVRDFEIELKASSGETGEAAVLDVHQGQIAGWTAFFKGRVTVGVLRVQLSDAFNPAPVRASAKVTFRNVDFGMTEIDGTVTNLGKATSNFEIELEAASGEVGSAAALDVLPGQTALWSAFFDGDVTVGILRVTT